MTPRRREYLRAIATLSERQGYAPTLCEVGDEMRVTRNAVTQAVAGLAREGLLTHDHPRSRTMRITPAGRQAMEAT